MNRLLITLEASRDLSEISDYFLAQNVDAGDRFVEAFGEKMSASLTVSIFGAIVFPIFTQFTWCAINGIHHFLSNSW